MSLSLQLCKTLTAPVEIEALVVLAPVSRGPAEVHVASRPLVLVRTLHAPAGPSNVLPGPSVMYKILLAS